MTIPAPQPGPLMAPPQAPKKGPSGGKIALIIVGVTVGSLILLVAACSAVLGTVARSTPGEATVVPAPPSSAQPTEPTPAPEPETTEEPPPAPPVDKPYQPKASDWKIKLKIKSKQCFGSAGCNVTYEAKVSRTSGQALPDSGIVALTYEVRGDESGTITETVDIDVSDGTYQSSDGYASTPSKGTKLKARVIEAEYSEF